MLDIDDAKLPPPKPDKRASSWKIQSGVSGFCKAIPVPAAGNMSSAVVKKIVLRPPAMRIKKLLGMRKVAPVRPAIAIKVNNSDFAKGKPRFNICTVIIPQYSQTAKPQSKLGIEIQRFLFAIFLPVDSQNWVSSTSHFFISVIVNVPGITAKICFHVQKGEIALPYLLNLVLLAEIASQFLLHPSET